MAPGTFGDIGKKAKDLLFKDYFYDSKFVFSSKTDSGLKVSSSSVRKGEELSSDLKTEFKIGEHVEAELKVDTKSKIHVKGELEDIAPGLKLILSGVVADPKSTKVEVKYKHDLLQASASAGLVAKPSLEASLAVGGGKVLAGAEVGYDTASSSSTKYNFGIAYAEKDYAASLLVLDKTDTVKASFYQKLRETSSVVAFELAHKVSKKDTTFTAGGSYKLDPLTESKVRINNRGIVGALVEHEFRPKSTIIFSTEFDTKALDKSSKLGVVLNLKV